MKPDFICIGAQKAGTTWLFKQLISHPEFSLPPIKEIHYFDRSPKYPSPNGLSITKLNNRIRRPSWVYESLKTILHFVRKNDMETARWYWHYFFSDYSDEWYLSLFDPAGNKLTGDITPSYAIIDEADVRHMYRIASNPKIVFLIRNPIERAWSAWRAWSAERYQNDMNDETFSEEQIALIKKELGRPGFTLRSDYLRTLDIYGRVFDSGQILIGFFDAISRDPDGLMKAILNHIGVENATPNLQILAKKYNVSQPVKIPEDIRRYLIFEYGDLIETLSNRFGSYTLDWLPKMIEPDKLPESGSNDYLPAVVCT